MLFYVANVEVARKLKTLAIQTIQAWHASYGEAYKKLALGYHFLKQVKKVRGYATLHYPESQGHLPTRSLSLSFFLSLFLFLPL